MIRTIPETLRETALARSTPLHARTVSTPACAVTFTAGHPGVAVTVLRDSLNCYGAIKSETHVLSELSERPPSCGRVRR